MNVGKGDSRELMVNRMWSWTVGGCGVNVLETTSHVLTLKAATLPTGTVYGHLRGQGLDSNFVHEGGW